MKAQCSPLSTHYLFGVSLERRCLDTQCLSNCSRSDEDFQSYMRSNYINGATDDDVGNLFDSLYPDDPSQGSPFGTGMNYSVPSQYKRLAAIQGDLVFQAPRRFFVEQTYDKQPTWCFRACYNSPLSICRVVLTRAL